VRIGDVALHALDRDLGVDRARRPTLTMSPKVSLGGGFAHHAVVDDLALGGERLDDQLGAVGRCALLVAGDQE
jgi:hypothetical protein